MTSGHPGPPGVDARAGARRMSHVWGEDQVGYLGDQGDHINELQQRLQETGFAVEVTGNFDQQTQDALNAFAESQSVARDNNGEAIIALQSATGALQHSTWENQMAARAPMQYNETAGLRPKYAGEQLPGNTVWAGQPRSQTHYPDQPTASDEYGVAVQGGRLTIPGEVDQEGNPVYLDTTDGAGNIGLVGTKSERMIYTMDTAGEVRAGDAATEQALHPGERFHHSSLSGGQNVAGAGEIKVREGTVEAVSDRSGHFEPDLALTRQVGERLAAGGVDTSQGTFELGNYTDGVQNRPDTLVSGDELESYDVASTLAQLQRECAARADDLGRRKWGKNAWDMLEVQNPALRQQDYTQFYNDLWAPIEQLGERALYREARRMLEQRHEQKRAMLAEIAGAMGWREDPLGRHDWRWYDGKAWTTKVSGRLPDGGEGVFIDEESAEIFQDDAVSRADAASQQSDAQRRAQQAQAQAAQLAAQQAAQQNVGGAGGYLPDQQNVGGYLPDQSAD